MKEENPKVVSGSDGDSINRLEGVFSRPLPDLDDPFHPDNLRISQDYLTQGIAKKLLTTVPVRKPNKQDFIRVHPAGEYRLNVALIELREDRETYLVHPKYFPQLDESLRSLHTIFTAINRQKVVFLWPVKLPAPDGRQNNWHDSALAHAEAAMTAWVRVVPNMSLGAYEVFVAQNQVAEPEWPQVPFVDLLKIAFKKRLIETDDHPVMQRLRGMI